MRSKTHSLSEPPLAYLKSWFVFPALAILLLLFLLYQYISSTPENLPNSYFGEVIYLLLGRLSLAFIKLPSYVAYLIFVTLLLVHVYFQTQINAPGEQDPLSTRDEAIELTTQAYLRGENPWNHVDDLEVPATTGSASILLATPFVLIFGDINWLAFVFWVFFFGCILIGDLRQQKNSFPILGLLFILGTFDFSHTLFWSLEELFFPFLFFVFAYVTIERSRYYLTGFLLAILILFRLNYLFLVYGFMLWIFCRGSVKKRYFVQLGAGFLLAIIILMLPFVLVGGGDFWTSNPFTLAFRVSAKTVWPNTNLIARGFNFMARNLSSLGLKIAKFGSAIALITLVAVRLGKSHHPYWHLAFAAFMAHTVVFLSRLPQDYSLMFVLPIFLALAFNKKDLAQPWI